MAKAAGPGVELIDAEQLFAEASAHGVPGRELFYEHVHMNPHGNYLIARALFPHVVALLPETVRNSATTQDPPSEEEADRLLALTAQDRRRIAQTVTTWLSQPPFTSSSRQRRAGASHAARSGGDRGARGHRRGVPLGDRKGAK